MKQLDEIRDLIRRGETSAARALLRKCAARKLDRPQRLRLAFLANTLEQPELALRLLHRVVRGNERSLSRASEEEKAEYALALGRSGSLREGIALMSALNGRQSPRFGIFLAFMYFRLHKLKEIVTLLRPLLASPRLTDIERFTAKIRLATALIHGPSRDLREADQLLEEVLGATSADQFRYSHWFALLIQAQSRFVEGRYPEARDSIALMLKLYPDVAESPDDRTFQGYAQYAEFWAALVDLYDHPVSEASLKRHEEIKARFKEEGLWEQTRMSDFYRAIRTRDLPLMRHVIYGSPQPELRAELRAAISANPAELDAPYGLRLEPETPSAAEAGWIEVQTGKNSYGKLELKSGQALQRLLKTLVSDFYVPFDTHMLHQCVFTDEHYNAASSPLRIRQLLLRLRKWFKKSGVPLRISEFGGRYSLAAKTLPVTVRIDPSAILETPGRLPPRFAYQLELLGRAFGQRLFSAAEAEAALGLARTSAIRVLREGLSSQSPPLLEKLGQGSASRYRLVKPSV